MPITPDWNYTVRLYHPQREILEAAEASAKAANSLQEFRRAGNVSGQYLANTVFFFASASGKFEQRRVRVVA